MERLSTLSLMERIPDEASAYAFLEELRWQGKPECPHCGNEEVMSDETNASSPTL